MAFLTIDAVSWYVQSPGGVDFQLVNVGATVRAFDGTLRHVQNDSFVETKGWQTLPLDQATAAAFLLLHGAFHTISGDAFGGATITALLKLTSTKLIPNGNSSVPLVIHTFDLLT